jgi:hypothetical protein
MTALVSGVPFGLASDSKKTIPLDGSFVLRAPFELAAITEKPFPFTEAEERDGVRVVEGSLSHQLLEQLINRSEMLVHPYYKRLGTIEDLGRQVASANEEEIKLHADYQDVADRVAYIDEKSAEGVYIKELNRGQLIRQSETIFSNWDKARMRVKRLEQLWMAYRNDRTSRLAKALEIYRKIHADVDAISDGEWTPDIKFASALKAQIEQLKAGIAMTPYYEMQNCVSNLIRRPLFAPSELSRNLEMSMKTDPYIRSPITGSVLERMQLLSVAY